ncbi:TonB-dependent receptor [Novosphingobium soli]|uniref:TonB-dependent receptor n=1 Tax=Novosphingobium soli TaxID=574956 RepID=A0ABV6CW72_9SPHN
MQRTDLRRTLLAAAATAATLATPAMAQEAARATDDGGDVDAIVVTARRTEERLQDVPISITVFNQEQISQRNIVSTADLATYTPSLSVNAKFGPEKASFVIRGFVQDLATQPSVGTYFADVVAPRAGGSTTSGNGVGVGSLFDLQNVQVLKGPQGTLFGRNTTGGAVLLVPRKPTDVLEGYVEGSLGSYDLRRVQAVLNVPLADSFKVRLGVDRMKRDGYLENHSGIGPDRLGNTDFIAARLSIVADLTPELENYTIATYSDSDNHGTLARVVGCNPASGLASFCQRQVDRQNARGDGWWDVENSEPDPRVHMQTWQVINTTTWLASDTLTVKNIGSYGEFRETTRYSLEGEFFTTPAGQLATTLIRINNTPGYNNASQLTWTEELQVQGQSADGGLKWQAGGYYEASDPIGFTSQSTTQLMNCQDSYAQLGRYLSGGPMVSCPAGSSASISIPFQKTWFRSKGLYFQGTYNLTDQFSVTGGVRYTWDRMTHRYDGTTLRFPTPGVTTAGCGNAVRVTNPDGSPVFIPSLAEHARCNVTFTAKSDKPTWLIDLDYKPVDDVLLYAKWARGYRGAGVASANVLLETWGPEKVDTYEVGAKASFHGAVRGYFNVAAFYNDFSDQQIQATLVRNPRPGNPFIGGSAIVNAGKSRIWGIEVDSSINLFDGLRVDAGYTYLDTKVLELNPPAVPADAQQFFTALVPTAEEGGPLALSPKHRLTLTGSYTLPLDESIGRISLGATYVYTSEQVMSLATAPAFQNAPATDLLNLNASWADVLGQPFDLSFFMTNVTNEKFPLNVNNAYGSFGLESQIVNEPRMYGFRLKARFGG